MRTFTTETQHEISVRSVVHGDCPVCRAPAGRPCRNGNANGLACTERQQNWWQTLDTVTQQRWQHRHWLAAGMPMTFTGRLLSAPQ